MMILVNGSSMATFGNCDNKLAYKQNIFCTIYDATMTTKLLMIITNTFLEVNFYLQNVLDQSKVPLCNKH